VSALSYGPLAYAIDGVVHCPSCATIATLEEREPEDDAFEEHEIETIGEGDGSLVCAMCEIVIHEIS
jgi:uncharacterized Zn finger protein (UPF0148 family)